MTAYGWEREEWRCAVEAAERAGELDYYDDRPTKRELDADEAEWERDEDFEGYDDE